MKTPFGKKLGAREKRIISFAPDVMKPALRAVFLGTREQRINALSELCKIGGRSTASVGRQLIKSRSRNPQSIGIYLIGRFGTVKDLPLLNAKMYSRDEYVRNCAISMMGMVREPKALEYLIERRRNGKMGVRKVATKAISIYKGREFELYNELSENENFKDQKRVVVRRGQDKDGTTTVLLGGKLYDKAIVRGGNIAILLNRKRAYEKVGLQTESVNMWIKALKFDWKKLGFSHIPIEPILQKNGRYRIYRNNDGSLRVSAGVIQGESFTALERKSILTEEQYTAITNQIQMIRHGLDELKIDHRHMHKSNYVVKFVNNSPRVYLIDFDMAKSA